MINIKKHVNQFGLVAAALGFVFGHTLSEFINAIVAGAIMPAFNLFFNIDDWQSHSIVIGEYSLV